MSGGSPAVERSAVVREYSRLAESYDTRWSSYLAASTRETLARLPAEPFTDLLDVGCGTGVLLEQAAGAWPGTRLAGVDPVAEMLAVARTRVPAAVELRRGWAERLPFDDARFDVVTSCNMFHYVREPLAALREMGRVLRPGGRLVLTDWCDDYLACRVLDWYLRRFRPAHHRVYGRRELRRLLAAAGWRRVEVERYKIGWWWGLMTARAAWEPAAEGEDEE